MSKNWPLVSILLLGLSVSALADDYGRLPKKRALIGMGIDVTRANTNGTEDTQAGFKIDASFAAHEILLLNLQAGFAVTGDEKNSYKPIGLFKMEAIPGEPSGSNVDILFEAKTDSQIGRVFAGAGYRYQGKNSHVALIAVPAGLDWRHGEGTFGLESVLRLKGAVDIAKVVSLYGHVQGGVNYSRNRSDEIKRGDPVKLPDGTFQQNLVVIDSIRQDGVGYSVEGLAGVRFVLVGQHLNLKLEGQYNRDISKLIIGSVDTPTTEQSGSATVSVGGAF